MASELRGTSRAGRTEKAIAVVLRRWDALHAAQQRRAKDACAPPAAPRPVRLTAKALRSLAAAAPTPCRGVLVAGACMGHPTAREVAS